MDAFFRAPPLLALPAENPPFLFKESVDLGVRQHERLAEVEPRDHLGFEEWPVGFSRAVTSGTAGPSVNSFKARSIPAKWQRLPAPYAVCNVLTEAWVRSEKEIIRAFPPSLVGKTQLLSDLSCHRLTPILSYINIAKFGKCYRELIEQWSTQSSSTVGDIVWVVARPSDC